MDRRMAAPGEQVHLRLVSGTGYYGNLLDCSASTRHGSVQSSYRSISRPWEHPAASSTSRSKMRCSCGMRRSNRGSRSRSRTRPRFSVRTPSNLIPCVLDRALLDGRGMDVVLAHRGRSVTTRDVGFIRDENPRPPPMRTRAWCSSSSRRTGRMVSPGPTRTCGRSITSSPQSV
jgi:hypothetical protein